MLRRGSPRRSLALLFLAVLFFVIPLLVVMAQTAPPPSVRPPGGVVVGEPEPPPVNILPEDSRSDIWRKIRRGEPGTVSIPNPLAGQLVQSEGENWRTVRQGPYRAYAGWFLILVIVLIAVFFILRGRVRVEQGFSGIRIPRFNFFERFVHWLTAISFIVLGLTGLNMLYGRELLMPLLGKARFAELTMWGKLAHNYLAFAFMLGIALIFLQWVWFNLPNRHDIQWLLRGGGIFGGGHPHARKFNAGQKLVFWIVVLGGTSLSLSGLQLLFPYQFSFFADTFAAFNAWFGTELPTELSPIQEQQLALVWHGVVGVFMIAVIIGHIYIGTLGMEGAFDAMWSGEVDLNWAREHHDLWVEELEAKGRVAQPAE